MSNALTREQVVLLVSDLVNGDINAQRGEAQLLAHDATFRQAHQQLQDTVKFQEAQYLKEHEHWGTCQWKLSHQQAVEALEEGLGLAKFMYEHHYEDYAALPFGAIETFEAALATHKEQG